MRIGTYNVLGLKGYPPQEAAKVLGGPLSEATADHFAGVFRALDCDVIALQEGVTVSQMQRIARALEFNLATFPSPVAWPGHVLTRYPILESRVFSHTTPHANERPLSRCAGAALLDLGAHGMLWVVDAHLHPSRRDLRDQEADILAERLTELVSGSTHQTVLGDFNSEVHEAFHAALRDRGFANAMEAVGGGIQATMDTAGIPKHFIDHIYVSPSLRSGLRSAEVVRESGFRHDGPATSGAWVHSDHLPVVAEIDLTQT